MSIPKIIHQLWISADQQDIPNDIKENIFSWERTHPDYICMMWSLAGLSSLFASFYGLPLLKRINACRFPAMQSDLVRLALLYEYGGFWSDLKNYILCSFVDDLIQYDKIVLAEHWPATTPAKYHPRLLNGFLGAPRKNKYIWRWLCHACENIEQRKARGVVGLTGAGVMMRIMKHSNDINYHLIKRGDLWNTTIQRRGGSYNDNDQHWSIRQKVETPCLS